MNYEQPQKYIVKAELYNNNYKIPVLTANKAFILGYTNEETGIYSKGDVIIYDDFTMDLKYVKFPFKVKSSAIKILTEKPNYSLYFLYCLLEHLSLKPYGHQRSYISIVEPMKIKCPTISEQEKIAKFLSLVDKRIEKQRQLVELLKKYKRGLLSQIFSQKLRFKDDNGNNYPDWEENRLGNICKIVGGGTPDTNNAEYWDDDINWVTPTEIIKKYISTSNRKISKLGLLKSSAKILPIGTVLLTTRATLGEMSILQVEAATNQGFQSLIPNKNQITSEFMYYCQPIIKHYCYKYANGSTFLEISKHSLAKLKLMIPNANEQNKISDFISKIDEIQEIEEKFLNILGVYKKGLLQQLFI